MVGILITLESLGEWEELNSMWQHPVATTGNATVKGTSVFASDFLDLPYFAVTLY